MHKCKCCIGASTFCTKYFSLQTYQELSSFSTHTFISMCSHCSRDMFGPPKYLTPLLIQTLNAALYTVNATLWKAVDKHENISSSHCWCLQMCSIINIHPCSTSWTPDTAGRGSFESFLQAWLQWTITCFESTDLIIIKMINRQLFQLVSSVKRLYSARGGTYCMFRTETNYYFDNWLIWQLFY